MHELTEYRTELAKLAAGVVLMGLAGCLAAGPEGTQYDESFAERYADPQEAGGLDARIAAALDERGFDPSDSVIDGDRVMIEGDMAVDLANLLEGGTVGDQDFVPKGYYEPISNLPDFSDLCVIPMPFWMYPDGDEVPVEWQEAFIWAVGRWNDETAVNIRYTHFLDTTCPAEDRIYLKYLAMPGVGVAAADLPTGNGHVGHNIRINKTPASECSGGSEELPPLEKGRTALHELGHTFGLRHPSANSLLPDSTPADHIPLTEETPYENPWAFPSVMHTGVCTAHFPIPNVWADLSPDDIHSMNVVVYLSGFD